MLVIVERACNSVWEGERACNDCPSTSVYLIITISLCLRVSGNVYTIDSIVLEDTSTSVYLTITISLCLRVSGNVYTIDSISTRF